MAALNDIMDSTGVYELVIDDMKKWREWLENVDDDDDDAKQEFRLSPGDVLNACDARYIVGCLQTFLPLEERSPRRKTELCLHGSDDAISPRAIFVFCDFLRQPTSCLLRAICLFDLHPKDAQRVLRALETNLSIMEIQIQCLEHCRAGSWIGHLLLHKTNFSVIAFYACRFPISDIFLFGLGRQHAHLRKLSFCHCGIDDEGTRLILEALRQCPILEHLDLSSNQITLIGLQVLTELIPFVLLHLKKLQLQRNIGLLDEGQSTQRFIDRILLSDDVAVMELDIGGCGHYVSAIIKSCEHVKSKLRVLGIKTHSYHRSQEIRDQLVDSLPRMKRLQELICDYNLFHDRNQPVMGDGTLLVDHEIMAALYENTSIVKITGIDEKIRILLDHILRRNRILKDMPPLMLAEDPPPKNGIWLLVPTSSSSRGRYDNRVALHYAFVQGSRVRSVQRGSLFPKGSIMLSFREGTCWIYAPTTNTRSNPAASAASTTTTTTNSHSWVLIAVRDTNVTATLFTFEWPGAEAAALVTDGRGAAYVLLPTDPGNASTCNGTLIHINSQYLEGKKILQQLVPCQSRLYRDRKGGVWVHVPIDNQGSNNSSVTTTCSNDKDSEQRLSPGIWYITPFQATCIVSHVSSDAKINLDGSRTGLLLVLPMAENDGDHDDSSLLVHVGPSGELHRRIIPVNFSKVAAVLDDGDRGALVHCRSSDSDNDRWKLYRAPWEEVNEDGEVDAAFVEFVYCPGREACQGWQRRCLGVEKGWEAKQSCRIAYQPKWGTHRIYRELSCGHRHGRMK